MNTYTYDFVYYTSLFIYNRFQNSLPSCCFIISQYMYPSLLHKMAPFSIDTAKKSSGGGPLDPPSNKTLSDPIIHINTEKITIKTFQQLNTLYNVLVVCKRYAKHRKLYPAPPLLNPSTNPPPPPTFFFFYFFFFAFSKICCG